MTPGYADPEATRQYPPSKGQKAMLHQARTRPLTPKDLVDRDATREVLRPLQEQPVIFAGSAVNPLAIGSRSNRPFPGGPSYLIAGPPPGVTRIPRGVELPEQQDFRHNPHGITVQPYDPEGLLTPDQVGPPIAIDHIRSEQRENYQYRTTYDESRGAPAINRTASGPVVGAGIVQPYRDRSRIAVNETPFPVASFEYQDLLKDIAKQPPDQRLATLDRAYDYFRRLHNDQAIAYDVTAETLADALRRLDQTITSGDDLTAKMIALQLPQYSPPPIDNRPSLGALR